LPKMGWLELRDKLARLRALPSESAQRNECTAAETEGTASGSKSDNKRKYFSVLHEYTHGNSKKAMSIASCPQSSRDATAELKTGMFTHKARKSNNSRLKTWDKLCKLSNIEQVQFSADEMTRVIAILNKAGYRSTASYVSDAKTRLIEQEGSSSKVVPTAPAGVPEMPSLRKERERPSQRRCRIPATPLPRSSAFKFYTMGPRVFECGTSKRSHHLRVLVAHQGGRDFTCGYSRRGTL
jgi:hypothetical protein